MLLLALALTLGALTGCGVLLESILIDPSAQLAASWTAQLDAARAQVAASPGAYAPASQFGSTALAWAQVANPSPEERAAVLREADGYYLAAIKGEPDTAWSAWAELGGLRQAAGDPAGAVEAFEGSQRLRPNTVNLTSYLTAVSETGGSVSETCAALRPTLGEEQVLPLMSGCEAQGDELAWASKADRLSYARAKDEAAAREAQRQAEAEAQAAAMAAQRAAASSAAASSASPSSSSGSSAPSVVSISLKNGCSETVRLFFGDTPKYGSGRTTTLGANTLSSESMRPGDMIWLVDKSDNGLASFTAGSSGQRVEVNSSCSGFLVQ